MEIDEVVKISDSVSVSGGGTATATGFATHAASRSIHAEVGLSRTQWDVSCTSFGALLGTPFGEKGMVIGGAAAYLWGRHRWRDE
jgi:hypothetical protein